MTNRRSLTTDPARTSRAFQFVPGHVGGRVASAQPVRRRNSVGAMAAKPGTPPDTLTYHALGASGSTTDTLPSLAGMESAVVLVGCIGANGIMTSTPSGWTMLLNDRSDAIFGGDWTPYHWAAFKIDEIVGGESLTYSWPARAGAHQYIGGMAIYASGGSGGYWHVHLDTAGGGYPGSVSFADVIPDGAPYGQWCGSRGGRNHTTPANTDTAQPAPLVSPVSRWPAWGSVAVGSLPAPLTPAQTMSWTSTYSDESPYARPMQAWWA